MLQVTPDFPDRKTEQRNLARVRRQAKKRGFRVCRAFPGWVLVDTKLEPPCALVGFEHADLMEIAEDIFTPLPPPRPRCIKIFGLAVSVATGGQS